MGYDFLEAIRFLTVLPVPSYKGRRARSLARAMLFFPLVGLLIGLVSLWLFAWLRPFLPGRVAHFALLLTPLLLSGGLHLDGFADFCDGFFGGKNKEETLRIMRDSRIGVWGTAGVALLLILKFELLQDLPLKSAAFLTALAASRWSQVALAYFLPYARSTEGLGGEVAQKVGLRELVGATFFLFVVMVSIRAAGLVAFLGLVGFLCLLGCCFKKKVGGITGDLLGAASEMSEVVIFLLVSAFYRGNPNL